MYIATCLTQTHDPVVAFMAIALCGIGAWITTNILLRLRNADPAFRSMWLALAGVAAATTTWCTHFVAVLAMQPAVELQFDPVLTGISLVVAVLGVTLSFWVASAERGWASVVLGGLTLGGSISAMHYIGMSAMTINALTEWRFDWVAVSVASSMLFGTAALACVAFLTGTAARVLGSLFFILSIATLHVLGLPALTIQPLSIPIEADGATRGPALFITGIGILIVLLSFITDQMERRSNEASTEKLLRMALFDVLTGLPNRAHISKHLEERIAATRRMGRRFAIYSIDLARFKEINELRGFAVGDAVLKAIAERMTTAMTGDGFVARTGADQFAVVKYLPYRGDDNAHVMGFARELHALICRSMDVGDDTIAIDAKIGIALYPADGTTGEEVLGKADIAMDRLKEDRGRFIGFCDRQIEEEARARRQLVEEMRKAMADDGFEIVYEPQINLATGMTEGYGARIRWRHPVRGLLHHSEFLPQAEATGMILAIKEMVLRKACADAASWSDPAKVSVRLSAMQLEHVDMTALIGRVLRETDLDPERLEVEVREEMIGGQGGRNSEVLRQIREMGVGIAITRFGSGEASLSTLGNFPFDRIGIDSRVVNSGLNDLKSQLILLTTITAARLLDIPVIADGVVTIDQKERLAQAGCSYVQQAAAAG